MITSGATDEQIKELIRRQRVRAREWEVAESRRNFGELRPYLTEDLLTPFVIERPSTPTEEEPKSILEEILTTVRQIRDWTKRERPDFISTAEVAELIGVRVKTIRRWVALSVFPVVPLPGAGHDYRFLRTSVLEWARQRELGNRK